MLIVTLRAGQNESVFAALPRMANDPWWVATMWDAYFGFLTFYVRVAYKEATWLRRGMWLLLILCPGNIAMAGYMLLQLFRLPSDATVRELLLRKN